MDTTLFTVVLCLTVAVVYCKTCDVSMNCDDTEGRSLCYEKVCRRDVPCNKDNDCFFYGAADVSQGYPHPKCFINDKVQSPPGYGVCMLREYAVGLARLPGSDVIDVEKEMSPELEREMKTIKNIFRIIK